jgi:uncharacterized protein (TIGR02271 family)
MDAPTLDVSEWTGRPVADRSGTAFGAIADVYLGRGTGEPEFVLVDLPNGARTIVPLTNAQMRSGALYVDTDGATVASAPPATDDPELTPEREAELYAFYGHRPPPLPADAAATTELPPTGEAPAELTRSEEQLVVDTEARPAERVRLRKRVVTEEVTVTIPLRREELVIEREPIEPGTAEAPADAQIVEADFDFVLLAEQPVIEKRVVPVEQIRLHKEVVVEEETISDHVRKERVDVEQKSEPPVTP